GWAITGSGGLSRGMGPHCLDLGCACERSRSGSDRNWHECGRGMAWRFARETNTLWTGATPEARRDFGAIGAPKYGVAPGHKTFFPASALLVVFIGLFLGFQVLVR